MLVSSVSLGKKSMAGIGKLEEASARRLVSPLKCPGPAASSIPFFCALSPTQSTMPAIDVKLSWISPYIRQMLQCSAVTL
eukprot:SAG22_NODE_1745_length_3666_cov_1.403140_5_plen_80_part_00